MKRKIFYSVILITISFASFGQRNIVLSSYPKKVPDGKKWILTTNKETLIEVDYGVLNDGSLCNALFLSSPGVIHGVLEGNYGNPKEGYTPMQIESVNVTIGNVTDLGTVVIL